MAFIENARHLYKVSPSSKSRNICGIEYALQNIVRFVGETAHLDVYGSSIDQLFRINPTDTDKWFNANIQALAEAINGKVEDIETNYLLHLNELNAKVARRDEIIEELKRRIDALEAALGGSGSVAPTLAPSRTDDDPIVPITRVNGPFPWGSNRVDVESFQLQYAGALALLDPPDSTRTYQERSSDPNLLGNVDRLFGHRHVRLPIKDGKIRIFRGDVAREDRASEHERMILVIHKLGELRITQKRVFVLNAYFMWLEGAHQDIATMWKAAFANIKLSDYQTHLNTAFALVDDIDYSQDQWWDALVEFATALVVADLIIERIYTGAMNLEDPQWTKSEANAEVGTFAKIIKTKSDWYKRKAIKFSADDNESGPE